MRAPVLYVQAICLDGATREDHACVAMPDVTGLIPVYGSYSMGRRAFADDQRWRGGFFFGMAGFEALTFGSGVIEDAPAKLAMEEALEVGAAKTAAALEKSALQEALAVAKSTSGHPAQLMTTLEDGARVIFRKDFGEQAHAIGGPFQGMGKNRSLQHRNPIGYR